MSSPCLCTFPRSWLGGVIVLTVLGVVVTYAMGVGRLQWTAAVKGHLSALGVGVLLLSAWNYQLEIYSLVCSRASSSWLHRRDAVPPITSPISQSSRGLLLSASFRALRPLITVALWISARILLGGLYQRAEFYRASQ
jgi:hypothetical protein